MNEDPGQKAIGKLVDDGFSYVQRGCGGGGGRIADVDHPLAFFEQEIVHHASVRGDRLGPNSGRSRLEVFRFDFGDQPLQSPHECPFVVGPPHLAQAHLPVFQRHFSKTGITEGLKEVLEVQVELAVLLSRMRERRSVRIRPNRRSFV